MHLVVKKFMLPIAFAVAASGMVALGPTPSAGAATDRAAYISSLALANVGKHACSRNSLGGKGFASSCTGNGGRPEYWCADFAKWVWANAGVKYIGELSPLAGSFYSYGLENGTLTGIPAVGDAAVFNYYGGGEAEHVAIVTAVEPNGTVETTSGDWGGDNGSEAHFSSTSLVQLNDPAYVGEVGRVPPEMGMVLSAFVQPLGVPVTPIEGTTIVPAGTTLSAGQSVLSPNGLYTLELNTAGELVEQMGSRVMWSTGTVGAPGDEAVMQPDGNFVLYSSTETPLWSSGTSLPGAALSVGDNGALEVSGPTGVLWSVKPASNSVLSGDTLQPTQKIVSPNGMYQLDMQVDGNLVEYTAGRALWSTKTHKPGASAFLGLSGNLRILTGTGRLVWASHGKPALDTQLQLLNNGALVIVTAKSIRWTNGV